MNKHKKDKDFDEEERRLVHEFETSVLAGRDQFFDVDEMEIIIDYYSEVDDILSFEAAVQYAERLYPDNTAVRLRRAHLLIAKQDYLHALDIVKELRRREPDNTDVAYSLGVAYSALGESRRAISHFLRAAEDGWQLGLIYTNIAEEYYRLRNYDEAIRYYQLALDTDSYEPDTLYFLVDACVNAHREEEAQTYLKSFLDEHPYSAEGWHAMGRTYEYMGLYEKAVDAYEYAIAADKRLESAYFDMAATLEEMGNIAEAASALLRAIDIVTDKASVYSEVAAVYARANNIDTSIIYYRKALESDPEHVPALVGLATDYLLSDDPEQAYPLAKKATRLSPENADSLLVMAMVYDMKDNYEAAYDCYDRMLDCEDCSEPQCRQFVIFLYQHKQYEEMVDYVLDCLDIYPHHPFYSTYLAAAYFSLGELNYIASLLPYVDTLMLKEICPGLAAHPVLGQLLPPEDYTSDYARMWAKDNKDY